MLSQTGDRAKYIAQNMSSRADIKFIFEIFFCYWLIFTDKLIQFLTPGNVIRFQNNVWCKITYLWLHLIKISTNQTCKIGKNSAGRYVYPLWLKRSARWMNEWTNDILREIICVCHIKVQVREINILCWIEICSVEGINTALRLQSSGMWHRVVW